MGVVLGPVDLLACSPFESVCMASLVHTAVFPGRAAAVMRPLLKYVPLGHGARIRWPGIAAFHVSNDSAHPACPNTHNPLEHSGGAESSLR